MDFTLPWNQQTWDEPLREKEICDIAGPHGVVQSTDFGVTVSTRVDTSLGAEEFRARLVEALAGNKWYRGIVSTLSVTTAGDDCVAADFFILGQWDKPTRVYFDELIVPFFDAVHAVSGRK